MDVPRFVDGSPTNALGPRGDDRADNFAGRRMTRVLLSAARLGSVVVAVMCLAASWGGTASAQDVAPTAPQPAAEVSVALVLAVDVSASINGERFQLQREGYATAVRHPAVIEAITGSQRGQIALAVVEWASANSQQVIVPWTLVGNAEDAMRIAQVMLAAPRTFDGLTAIGNAINFSAAQFESLPYSADRRVIDVSGDGVSNDGSPPAEARDAAVARGITINGLAIMEPGQQVASQARREPRLDEFYRENVVGGPGAFVIAVEEFESFSYALVAKIVREVADVRPPVSVASAASARY